VVPLAAMISALQSFSSSYNHHYTDFFSSLSRGVFQIDVLLFQIDVLLSNNLSCPNSRSFLLRC